MHLEVSVYRENKRKKSSPEKITCYKMEEKDITLSEISIHLEVSVYRENNI